jgi:NAD+ kinase
MQRVLILGDERKGRIRSLVAAAARQVRARGLDVDVVVDRDSCLADRNEDLVVVFGGDGSMLAAARRMGQNQMPTVGVNLGRLGFLTAFGDDEAATAIDAALDGELVEEPRMMLRCTAVGADGAVQRSEFCLNDGVLTRMADAGIITIVARWGLDVLATYSGDGLIVSTPVGSTAYSLAAGGPILSPRMEAIVLSPLAPHMLTLRPLVLPLEDGLELEVVETGGVGRSTFTVDGQVHWPLVAGDRIQLEVAAHRFRHLTRGPMSFFGILRDKFGWSDTPRRRT